MVRHSACQSKFRSGREHCLSQIADEKFIQLKRWITYEAPYLSEDKQSRAHSRDNRDVAFSLPLTRSAWLPKFDSSCSQASEWIHNQP
jgi:hypothetical protein